MALTLVFFYCVSPVNWEGKAAISGRKKEQLCLRVFRELSVCGECPSGCRQRVQTNAWSVHTDEQFQNDR